MKSLSNGFYLTTPLYYVNDRPHLGTAYSTIVADVLARYHRFFNEPTILITGVDEHGQKVQEASIKNSTPAQDYCDQMALRFKEAWSELNIQYDIFFRTTNSFHKLAVQQCLQNLFNKGEIYTSEYEGWYSVSEEIFYTEKDLINGKSPTGKEVTKVTEKNYFFKMSNYQQKLMDHIQNHESFICPESRRNEVLGFLRQPLNDLCISRPKSRLTWGIDLPFDSNFVTYVWFDALLNYATGVGYLQKEREKEFQSWWVDVGAIHLIGKDILTTHAVYWTTMLLALELPLPKQIFAHGWILNKDMEKMSKSSGSIIDPLALTEKIGVDSLRYFLIRDIHLGNDAPISKALITQRINTELANNLGNLFSRTTQLVEKFFNSEVPQPHSTETTSVLQLKKSALSACHKVKQEIEQMSPHEAVEVVVQLLNLANKYLEDEAPWKLTKTDLNAAGTVLYVSLEILRISSALLSPIMPEKMEQIKIRLGSPPMEWNDLNQWGLLKPGTKIVKGDSLFPRLEESSL